jgi:hypothetical protein
MEALLLSRDLVRKPVPTFRDHAVDVDSVEANHLPALCHDSVAPKQPVKAAKQGLTGQIGQNHGNQLASGSLVSVICFREFKVG